MMSNAPSPMMERDVIRESGRRVIDSLRNESVRIKCETSRLQHVLEMTAIDRRARIHMECELNRLQCLASYLNAHADMLAAQLDMGQMVLPL